MRPGDTNYPAPSSATATAIMQSNRPEDTTPEVRLRSLLHRAGLRFWRSRTLTTGGVRTRPDVMFPRARVAVFLNGCFWHGCPKHGSLPKSNAQYWEAKFLRNRQRDRRVDQALGDAGWVVIRVWEHDDLEGAAEAIARKVRRG